MLQRICISLATNTNTKLMISFYKTQHLRGAINCNVQQNKNHGVCDCDPHICERRHVDGEQLFCRVNAFDQYALTNDLRITSCSRMVKCKYNVNLSWLLKTFEYAKISIFQFSLDPPNVRVMICCLRLCFFCVCWNMV